MFTVIEIIYVVVRFFVRLPWHVINGVYELVIDVEAFYNLHFGSIPAPVMPDLIRPPLGVFGD